MTTVPEPQSALLVDIGTLLTRVTLIDTVEGEARVIGQADHATTLDAPHHDAVAAVLGAALEIGERTGRQLVTEGRLILPRGVEGDGVSRIVFVTSAAPVMQVVVAAVGSDTSARSAQHAVDGLYARVVECVTLDDAPDADQDRSWIERQASRLVGERPDCVLIVGGVEGGAQDGPLRLARMLALVYDVRNENERPPPMVYAGNSATADAVAEALTDRTALARAANLRPSLEHENLAEVRNALRTVYRNRVLMRITGSERLEAMGKNVPRVAVEASELVARFLAERYDRRVLTVDLGASHTVLHATRPGTTDATVATGIGAGYGARETLIAADGWEIARWLPYGIDDRTLVHQVFNIALRPQIMPASREDLLLRLAIARAALGVARQRLRNAEDYDFVLASGGVLQHAGHPGLALLTLLDALQPGSSASAVMIEVHLDGLGLLNSIGALASVDADAALTVFDRDLMAHTPLATCVVPRNLPGAGQLALTAELYVSGGGSRTVRVESGSIGVLPLPPGARGTLRLQPAGGVRVGANRPGEEVKTDEAAVGGSALGVVIDARGRPLQLAEAPLARQQQLWGWMQALGVERDQLPYPEAQPYNESEVVLSASGDPRRGTSFTRASRATENRGSSQPETNISGIDADLARLRQQVNTEPPKRRGLFGRK